MKYYLEDLTSDILTEYIHTLVSLKLIDSYRDLSGRYITLEDLGAMTGTYYPVDSTLSMNMVTVNNLFTLLHVDNKTTKQLCTYLKCKELPEVMPATVNTLDIAQIQEFTTTFIYSWYSSTKLSWSVFKHETLLYVFDSSSTDFRGWLWDGSVLQETGDRSTFPAKAFSLLQQALGFYVGLEK